MAAYPYAACELFLIPPRETPRTQDSLAGCFKSGLRRKRHVLLGLRCSPHQAQVDSRPPEQALGLEFNLAVYV